MAINSSRAGTKRSTDNMHPLDIRKIARAGLLTPGSPFSWQWSRGGNVVASISITVYTSASVTLDYRARKHGEWENKRYDVMVDWTPCNYGGKRPWWLCPCCGRRVAVLWGGGTYACRHCQQINYESTRNTPESQAFARAGKVRKQLGWCAGIANPPGGRPKGMHQRTYERLLHHYYELANQAFGASSEAMDKVMGRLRGIPFKPI
jgi:hypothetical protein